MLTTFAALAALVLCGVVVALLLALGFALVVYRAACKAGRWTVTKADIKKAEKACYTKMNETTAVLFNAHHALFGAAAEYDPNDDKSERRMLLAAARYSAAFKADNAARKAWGQTLDALAGRPVRP